MKQMLLLAANVQEETEDKVTHKPSLHPFVLFTLNLLNTVNRKRIGVTKSLDPNAVGLQLGAELVDVVRRCVERYRSGEQCFTIKLRDYETERTRT